MGLQYESFGKNCGPIQTISRITQCILEKSATFFFCHDCCTRQYIFENMHEWKTNRETIIKIQWLTSELTGIEFHLEERNLNQKRRCPNIIKRKIIKTIPTKKQSVLTSGFPKDFWWTHWKVRFLSASWKK